LIKESEMFFPAQSNLLKESSNNLPVRGKIDLETVIECMDCYIFQMQLQMYIIKFIR